MSESSQNSTKSSMTKNKLEASMAALQISARDDCNRSSFNLSVQQAKTPAKSPKLNKTGNADATPCNGKMNRSALKLKTPSRTPAGHDRFIPNRSAMNMEVNHYLVSALFFIILLVFRV